MSRLHPGSPALDRTTSWTRRHTWLGLGLLAALGVFYMATLRPGHTASDFFRLLEHARNLVEGRAYNATWWIGLPGAPPVTFYPPAMPLLLAPLYALFGLNLTALKGLIVASFLAALVFFAALVRKDLPPAYVFLAAAFVGLQPWLWELKDQVTTEIPFLMTVCLALVCVRSHYDHADPGTRGWWTRGIAVGLSAFAAAALRTVGMVFLPTLLVYDLLKRRRWWPSRHFWLPAGVFAVCTLLQHLLIGGEVEGHYLPYFLAELERPLGALRDMAVRVYSYLHGSTVNMLFENGYLPVLRYLVGGLILGLAAFGLVAQLRRRVSITAVFAACYAGILMIYPFQFARFLIPLHAILFFYAVYGLYLLARRVQQPVRRRALVAGVAALVFATYLMNYTTRDFQKTDHNLMSPAATEMYAYVAEHVPEDETVVFREPNALALLARHRTTMPEGPGANALRYTPEQAERLFDLFESVNARYLLAGPRTLSAPDRDILPLWNLPRDYPGRFELVYRNEECELYRITDA